MGSQFSSVNSGVKAKPIIKIWDAATKSGPKKVNLKTSRQNIITWYACGPTVYDSSHIGHASSYIRLDTMRRILERQNYQVLQIMGITDIDDKIINKADQLQVSWESLGRKYEAEFCQELKSLNIKSPLVMARVTNFIPQIVSFIENLISSGFAYATSDGSVYFDSAAYGQPGLFQSSDDLFSRSDLADAVKLKKRKADFALWKGVKLNEPYWVSPWGKGRPGWHIECSVIATHYFGSGPLDIHSGGCDLMFPHHQCEEMQCCARFGLKNWVTHWIHTGHLIVSQGENEKDGVKMAKSLGNTVTIKDFLNDHSPNILRMFCLRHHSRRHLCYCPESLEKAKFTLRRFESFIVECDAILQGIKTVTCSADAAQYLWNKIPSIQTQVEDSLCDDFDTPAAIAFIDEFISDFYRRFQFDASSSTISANSRFDLGCKGVESDRTIIQNLNPILQDFVDFRQRVRYYSLALDEADKQRRKQLIQERQSLVDACDQIRSKLGDYGIDIKDHGKNTSWSIKQS